MVYIYQDIMCYFSDSYYAIVKGKVPFEVSNIIYEKYPNNPYGIRVDGGNENYIPKMWAKDEKYEQEIKSYIEKDLDAKDFIERVKKSKKNLLRRKDDNKYIDNYHVDTKEGLVVLLSEMKDYYARKNNMPESEAKRFEELIETINKDIIKKMNFNITNYEWIKMINGNEELCLSTKENLLRKTIENFDKTVNPYMNEEIDLQNSKNYSEKLNITTSIYKENNIKNCCYIDMTDLNTKNSTSHYRNSNGFSYNLSYAIDESEYFIIKHYYLDKRPFEQGEKIYIYYGGDKVKQKIDLIYNLSSGYIKERNNIKRPITIEEIKFIQEKLEKATALAKTITIDNMVKKGKYKKLVRTNN